jgi:eukaryotic-like serine/threonine-protein kinase
MDGQTMTKSRRNSKRSTKVFAGRYAYQKPLGRGAGGSVYLAEDLYHKGRAVALKVLTPEAYQTVQGKMLRREFEILSKLDHSHLVRVYDYGTLPDGGVYLAEEYIDGFSMQDARALLEPEALVDVTIQILQGLSYLHGMGTIHRDIKPANVMLLWLDDASARPMVKLVDFGLSSMDPKRDTLRGGTRSYMAPEIIRGDKGEERSDLYSLGVTLYYTLCGVLPFGPRTKDDPPPTDEDFRPPEPHRLNSEVPLVLSRFTMALLRQIPDVDYADAGEALQALAADSGAFDELTAGRMANALDVAAAPVLKGYFERGILERRLEEDDYVVEWIGRSEARAGGSLLLMTGERGCGKSRLLSDIESSAKLEGHLIVSAACAHPMPPFGLIEALLRQTIELGLSHKLAGLEKYQVPAQVRRLMTRMGIVTAGEGAEIMEEQRWMRRAFEDVVAMLAPMRLVFFIDDLAQADEHSLHFLREWFEEQTARFRPFVVAASDRQSLDRRFRALPGVEWLPIEGVTADDVEAFFRLQLKLETVEDSWIADVASYAGGKPDAIEELCRALIDAGLLTRRSARAWGLDDDGLVSFAIPSGMKESFRRRMTSVGAGGRECLELLALLKRPVLWESARELLVVGGGSPEKADRLLQTLQWRHLTVTDIQANGRFISLIHPDLAEVVGDMMSREWRRALHRRIGRQLMQLWQSVGGDPGEAAEHLLAGGLEEEAGTLFEVSGDELSQQGDYQRAMAAYTHALDTVSLGPARALLHLKLARLALALFDARSCRRHLSEAGEIAEHTALDWLMYQVFTDGADMTMSLGDGSGARDWMARLKESLPWMTQTSRVHLLEARLAICVGDCTRAASLLDLCLILADQNGTHGDLIAARGLLASVSVMTTGADEGLELHQQALEIAEEWGDEGARAMTMAMLGSDLRRVGQTVDALDPLHQCLEPLLVSGQSQRWIWAMLELARCHASLGDSHQALARGREALRFARLAGHDLYEDLLTLFLGGLMLEGRGDLDPALRSLEPVVRSLEERSDFVLDRAEALIDLGELLLRAGEEASAQAILRDARQLAETSGAIALLSEPVA